MKNSKIKQIKIQTIKILCGLLILSAAISCFTSCKQDVIFYDIAQEIEYEDPIVTGNVVSMVPCKGELFVQNNFIYQKGWTAQKTPDARWVQSSIPADGKPVVRLASDSSYLYAFVKESALDLTGTVYAAAVNDNHSLGSWTQVAENVKELFDNRFFDNSNGTTANRRAYFTNNSNAVKQLNGTTFADPSQTVADVFSNTDSYIRAADTDGTTDYFSSDSIFAVINISGTVYLYRHSDNKIQYRTSGTTVWTDGGTTQSIITTLVANGSDQLIIGTQSGLELSAVNSSGVPANGENAPANAESAFGTRYVTGAWHYGASGTLYTAVIGVEHSKYNKLWGYYSGGKWNYE